MKTAHVVGNDRDGYLISLSDGFLSLGILRFHVWPSVAMLTTLRQQGFHIYFDA